MAHPSVAGTFLFAVAVAIAHVVLPRSFIIWIAFAALFVMLFPYPMAALAARNARHSKTEVLVSLALGTVGAAGLFSRSPMAIALAIFAHGAWDLCKHMGGAGVPYSAWYLKACVIFDWSYAIFLYKCEYS